MQVLVHASDGPRPTVLFLEALREGRLGAHVLVPDLRLSRLMLILLAWRGVLRLIGSYMVEMGLLK